MLCAADGWNILCIFSRSIWTIVLLKSAISLLAFCLGHLSIIKNTVLKFSIVIILLSISPFGSVNVVCIYISALMRDIYLFVCIYFYHTGELTLLSLCNELPCLLWQLFCYFVSCKYSYLCSLLVIICMGYLFLSLHSQPMCVLKLNWVPCKQHIVVSCFIQIRTDVSTGLQRFEQSVLNW